MSDLQTLKGRIDRAVHNLNEVQSSRRTGNDSLVGFLGDLESEYRARDEELRQCSRRIDVLEDEHCELARMVEQLVEIMEAWAGQGNEDPIFNAAAVASNILEDWQSVDDGPDTLDLPAATGLDATMSFDDVDADVLADETAQELLDADLPDLVSAAIADAVVAGGPQAVEDIYDEPIIEELASAELQSDPELAQLVADDPPLPGNADDAVMSDIDTMLGEDEFADLDGAAGVSPEDLADMLIQDMTETVDIEIPDVEPVIAPPGPLPVAGEEDTEANIRAMMARLEQAADRARTALEPGPEHMPVIEPPLASTGSVD